MKKDNTKRIKVLCASVILGLLTSGCTKEDATLIANEVIIVENEEIGRKTEISIDSTEAANVSQSGSVEDDIEESEVPKESKALEENVTTEVVVNNCEEKIQISVDGMSMEEFLSTYGVTEYVSEYLRLKPIEDVVYVPFNYELSSSLIRIYYKERSCGYIRMVYMEEDDWVKGKRHAGYAINGPRTSYDELEIPELSEIGEIVFVNCARSELYGTPDDIKWLLENEKILSEENVSGDIPMYEITYGVEGYKYGYYMGLAPYFINYDMLIKLAKAVEFTDKSFTEATTATKYGQVYLTGSPGTSVSHSDLKMFDNPNGYLDFTFIFKVGNLIYEIPENTVAVASDEEWKLYAYAGETLHEIGTVKLSSFDTEASGDDIEVIARQYIGENIQEEKISNTDYGFEYSIEVDGKRTYYIFNLKDFVMLSADYYISE